MKRALAERAKQSGLPNGVGTSTNAIQEKSLPSSIACTPNGSLSSTILSGSVDTNNDSSESNSMKPQRPVVAKSESLSLSQPSQKSLVKIKKSSSKPTSKTKTTLAKVVRPSHSTSISSSPRPKKRARESSVKLEEEDEDDSNAASFYLRHQNRALASELRSVKYQVMRLEREREHRRTQCLQAVQSLNNLYIRWGKVEAALHHLNNQKTSGTKNKTNFFFPKVDAPPSTGSGKSVEWIDALVNSLSRIGRKKFIEFETKGDNDSSNSKDKIKNGARNNDEADVEAVKQMSREREYAASEDEERDNHITDLAERMAERFSLLHSWISTLLQNLDSSIISSNGQVNGQSWSTPSNMELKNQVVQLEAENLTLQELVNELSRSRDEMVESDRRVRRGLYRLAAGRVKLKEVLKAVANADEEKESAVAWLQGSTSLQDVNNMGANIAHSSSPCKGTGNTDLEKEDSKSPMSSKEIEQLKKSIADLNVIASSRNEQIRKLMSEKEDQMKRINHLLLKEKKTKPDIPTIDDVLRSDLYLKQTAKLAETTRKLETLDEKSSLMRKEWSTALADADVSKKALEDMQTTFSKRWKDLTEGRVDKDTIEEKAESLGTCRVKDVVMLQHKLNQAMENVRQVETLRKTLNEAISMNNSLQSKVDEFKAKYIALQAEKAIRLSSSGGGNSSQQISCNSTPSKDVTSTSRSKSSSSAITMDKADRSIDKLQRDYKRARKELASAIASKDAAKGKLERTEKEKDFLSHMNSRLLKQASEKDEINARSLSTILHLKQLSEQMKKEKENFEQQVKSAGQLALAARLASNSRNRLTEEFSNEKKLMKSKLDELEKKVSDLAMEKELAEVKFREEKAAMSRVINDSQTAKKRCEELSTLLTKADEEKQKMIESLAIAQRKESEATRLSQKLANSKGGGLVAGFTAEQLSNKFLT
eukprot:CAMPEP_0197190514 /NCGR_PEP_ID=MMETSP1423-20130617/21792_1 /TAXON_ID=476441 /ORGANISM="Pseudo-nitzschia heimii, Strain UNC1101" /LENGTH=935 /DNA_ID=CAMNT_0042642913 /DNA_START=260 /DNA_END=3068 /DNA_ORIENTATION=-